MEGLLRFLRSTARGAELALAVGQVLLRRTLNFTRRILGRRAHFQLRRKLVDFALALDHAMGLGVRHVECQSARRQQMSGARNALPMCQRQFRGQVIGDAYAGQPFIEYAGPARIVATDLAAQAVSSSARSAGAAA
jgi:hypothetical protein